MLEKMEEFFDNRLEGYDEHMMTGIDTSLTVQHEREALLEEGFSSVEVLNSWGATVMLRANK